MRFRFPPLPCVTVVLIVPAAGSTAAREMDDLIIASATNSYNFKTWLKDDRIHVAAKQGTVTLTGMVQNEFHRNLAEATLAGLPGVKAVNNQLSLKEVPANQPADSSLRERVRTALLLHREFSGRQITVAVDKGVVILAGETASKAQRRRLAEYVRGLDGVAQVVDRMSVSRKPQPRGREIRKRIDDASITAQAKLALLFNRATSALRTQVRTENGVVTLTGQAASKAEREQVRRVVQGIDGVRLVRNQIVIVPG